MVKKRTPPSGNLNEGIDTEPSHSCFICNSKGKSRYRNLRDRLFNAPGIWEVMECPDCHLMWLNPSPIPRDIPRLYENYFTHEESPPVESRIARFRMLLEDAVLSDRFGYETCASHFWQRKLGRLLALVRPVRDGARLRVMTLERSEKSNLLDVGCGNGHFLAKMRNLGWEVTGVEPDRHAAAVARDQFGIPVREGLLEDQKFPNDAFYAITMNHVIEHLLDPIRTLQECRRILKPGGKLIIVTPNNESLGSRLFKDAWFPLDPPRHLFLFTAATLSTCAERAKLRPVTIKTTTRLARWIWATSRLIRRDGFIPGGIPPSQGTWGRVQNLLFQTVEGGISFTRPVGEELVLIATKQISGKA